MKKEKSKIKNQSTKFEFLIEKRGAGRGEDPNCFSLYDKNDFFFDWFADEGKKIWF